MKGGRGAFVMEMQELSQGLEPLREAVRRVQLYPFLQSCGGQAKPQVAIDFSLEGFILLVAKVHYPRLCHLGTKKKVLLKKPPNTENNGVSAIYFTDKGSFED